MYYWWSFLSSLMWTVNKGDQKQLYQLSVEQWLKRYKNQLQWIYSSLKVCIFDCFHSRYIRMWCLYFSQNLLITVSQLQNHRRAEVGRVLWRSSGPSPLLSQSRIQSVPWTRHISNKGDLTTSLGSLCPSSDILTVKKKKKKCFLMLKRNLLCFRLCLLSPVTVSPAINHHNKFTIYTPTCITKTFHSDSVALQ